MKKITKNYLIKEYYEKEKSMQQIANKIGCSLSTIRNRLVKYNIKIRTISESKKGNKNGGYIDGRTLKKCFCKICGKIVSSYKTKKCQKCYLETMKGIGNPMFGIHRYGKSCPRFKDGRSLKKNYCIDCGKQINWQSRRCSKCANKEEKNPSFGKPCPHIKHSKYKEIWMRSSYETKFAFFLDLNEIKWQYEPKRFDLGKLTYLPDFYLSEFDCYIEIKGW